MSFTGRFGNKPYVPAQAPVSATTEFPILTPGKSEKKYYDPLFPNLQKQKASGQQAANLENIKEVRSNLMDSGPDDDGNQPSSAGSSGNIDRTGLAQSYGYEQGQAGFGGFANVLGMAAGIPGVGFLSDKLGGDTNYGEKNTTDAYGNIFGADGRAYDPITGRAVGSYRDRSAYKDAVVGGYGNLRDAGLNPIASGLGSYENSIYNFGATEDPATHAAARAARLRGGDYEATGLGSTAALINQNTFDTEDEDPFAADGVANKHTITGEQLGFDDSRAFSAAQASENTGVWGTNPGDLAASEFGPGVINESGQIEHAGGTVVALTDTSNPGGPNISLLNGADNAAAQAELARRAAPTPPPEPTPEPPAPAPEPERDDHDPFGTGQTYDSATVQQEAAATQSAYEQEAYGGGGGGGSQSGVSYGSGHDWSAPKPAPAPEPQRDDNDDGGGGGGGGGK